MFLGVKSYKKAVRPLFVIKFVCSGVKVADSFPHYTPGTVAHRLRNADAPVILPDYGKAAHSLPEIPESVTGEEVRCVCFRELFDVVNSVTCHVFFVCAVKIRGVCIF